VLDVSSMGITHGVCHRAVQYVTLGLAGQTLSSLYGLNLWLS